MNNAGINILSILCPTLPSRKEQFDKLSFEITGQAYNLFKDHPMLGTVSFIWDDSPSFLEGGLSIGQKCNLLVKRAEGKYLLILHDDDWIAPNFVESIVRLCQHDRDICTFRSISKLDDFWMLVDMSLHYQNDQPTPKYMIRRRPFPICAVRSEFAKQFKFPDTNYSEDSDWMEQVLTRCSHEAHSEEILHEYRHSSKTSEADKIIRNEAIQSK